MRRPSLPAWRSATALRLAGFHALLLGMILAAVTFGTVRAFTSYLLRTTDGALSAEVVSFSTAAGQRPAGTSLESFTVGYLRHRVLPQGEFVVVTLDGGKRIGSAGSEPLMQALAGRDRAGTTQLRVEGAPTEVATVPLTDAGRRVGTLVVSSDLSRMYSDRGRVVALVTAEAVVALAVGAAGAYLLLRRLLRGVGAMTTTAAAIGGGDLDQRLGDPGTGDEMAQLASTFDWMLDRMAAAMGSQRQLLSDVSHQLRTPLTVMRGHLEVLGRTGAGDPEAVHETLDTVVEEVDHMRALVDRLLLLGRALEPDFLEVRALDLRTFLADILDAAEVLAPRHWSLAPVPDLLVEADEGKLRGALLNLVDNAVRATATQDHAGDARIALSAEVRPDGSLAISVDDSGPGIPEDRRQAALTRFARGDSPYAEGSGLGLAIVKAVAETHGGRLELDGSGLGGCRATLVLPEARTAVSLADLEERDLEDAVAHEEEPCRS